MNTKRIVIALGGNALQSKDSEPTAQAQLEVVRKTCRNIACICGLGYKITIVHGNGPQVGRIVQAGELAGDVVPPMPFDVCNAMSQGYIGYHIQQALVKENALRGIDIPVATIVTQVVVDKNDPAFNNPTKPIGSFYSREEALNLEKNSGYIMKEDSGRGWRRVAPSPLPKEIVEIEAIRCLGEYSIVVACGGGGIPVSDNGGPFYEGVAAVIDKDYAAELLAEQLDADILLILTEVEKVAINYNTPTQKNLSLLTANEAEGYIAEGQFDPGSMLPKVRAALNFVKSGPERTAIITSLDKAVPALRGNAGTVFKQSAV